MSEWTSVLSSIFHLTGYVFFWLGVTSNQWRSEMGYSYGLWFRCDEDACDSLLLDTAGYLLIVQCGVAGSFLLLTLSVLSVVIVNIIKLCKAKQRHVIRTNHVICVSAASGEILAAAAMFIYGYKTVLARDRYPSLMWGFPVTGLGVICSLLGNILGIMGPVSTWENGLSCLLPKRRRACGQAVYSYGSATYSADSTDTQRGSGRLISSKRHGNKQGGGKGGVTSCVRKGCCDSSVQSSVSGASDINYRHYEEISYEDMPPPPLELLHPPPPGDVLPQNVVIHHHARPFYAPQEYSLSLTYNPHTVIQPRLIHEALGPVHLSGQMYYSQFQTPALPASPPPPPPPPPAMSLHQYSVQTAVALPRDPSKPTPRARQQQARPNGSTLPPPTLHSRSAPSGGQQRTSRARPRPASGPTSGKCSTLPSRSR
ncbi:hypothetical protein Btru_070638 [Bulinus truncatus]|nr:hypothetical protein Btru_070638 [Bulinus truncatus]